MRSTEVSRLGLNNKYYISIYKNNNNYVPAGSSFVVVRLAVLYNSGRLEVNDVNITE